MTENVRIAEIRSMAECNEFQYLLLGDLRDILEETPDESNRRWLLAILDVLVQLMPRELRLHSDNGGYMNQVLQEFPGWNQRVMTLHLRKLQLDYALRELRDHLRSEKSYVAIADRVSVQLRDWMDTFVELHQEEASLMMDAMLLHTDAAD